MKNLGTFLSEFQEGFQPNNRFAAKVFPPALNLTDTEREAKRWLESGFLCNMTRLPDRAFEETQMTQYGLTEQFPFHTQYTSQDCMFNTPLKNGDNPVPRVFSAWQNLIQEGSGGYNESTRDFTFPSEFYGGIKIGMLDRANRCTLLYLFENVYPKTVESVPVMWSEQNEVATLSVSFTFSSWSMQRFNGEEFFNPDPVYGRSPSSFQNDGLSDLAFRSAPTWGVERGPGNGRFGGNNGFGIQIGISTRIGNFTINF
jgi:hypothetical protein